MNKPRSLRRKLIALFLSAAIFLLVTIVIYWITLQVWPDMDRSTRTIVALLVAALSGIAGFFSGLKDLFDMVLSFMDGLIPDKGSVNIRLRIIPEFQLETGRGTTVKVRITNLSNEQIFVESVSLILTTGRQIKQSDSKRLEKNEPCDYFFPLFGYSFDPQNILEITVEDTTGTRHSFPITKDENKLFEMFKKDLDKHYAQIPKELLSSTGQKEADEDTNTSSSYKWDRVQIVQWHERPQMFEPIPLEREFVTRNLFKDNGQLQTKPLLGKEQIPFLLRTDEDGEFIRGIERIPAHHTDRNLAVITPGAKDVISAFVLLSAGNALRMKKGIKLEGRQIGTFEFQHGGQVVTSIALILGYNIRSWRQNTHSDVGMVTSLSAPNIEQVWRSTDDDYSIDMLRIDFDQDADDFPISRSLANVDSLKIVAQCTGLPSHFSGNDIPSVLVYGLTYMTRT